MADDTAVARAAWTDYTAALARLGERIVESPEEGYYAADGLEHVLRQTVSWSAWGALHADPTRPFFQRQLDVQTQWGGPNADNVYRHAPISPKHRYRIHGRMHSCEDFILALRAGLLHNEVWGTKVEVTGSDLGIQEGGEFQILLGGDEEGAIAIPDDVIMVSIREYYIDWRPEEPAVFTIECLDPPPPARLETAESVRRTRAARTHVVDSMKYWHDYMETNRARQVDNEFPETMKIAKGLKAARYENCYWSLRPDEALIMEAVEPDARYWCAQVYLMDTFDLVDRFGRSCSRNHLQTHVSSDGKVRWIISAEDPGVPNWLDSGGRSVGLCMVRWFWPRSEEGLSLRNRVVKISEVRAHLPADEPTVSLAERAAEMSRRQAHLRWRFRI